VIRTLAAALAAAGAAVAYAQAPQPAAAPTAPTRPAATPAPARPVASPAAAPAPAPAAREAVVGALDKRTGRSQFFTMKPGETVAYGPLAIRLATCETTPPWVSPKQSGGFIQVDETVRRGGAATTVRRVFSGWLFAESPSLNAMRHPVFDVWLKSCTMSFPAGPAPRASPAPRTSPSSAKKSAPARTAEPKADT
jgi:hypothetical protein